MSEVNTMVEEMAVVLDNEDTTDTVEVVKPPRRKRRRNMPRPDMKALAEVLTDEEMELVAATLVRIGGNEGKFRIQRPNPPATDEADLDAEDMDDIGVRLGTDNEFLGEARFLWRMVVFAIGPMRSHQCLPIGAFFYLGGPRKGRAKVMAYIAERHEQAERLMDLADKVIDSVPVDKWHGVRAWAEALGTVEPAALVADEAEEKDEDEAQAA